MPPSRLHPETQYKAIGATVAHKGGDRAALSAVMTGKLPMDTWINEGFEVTSRRLALRDARRASLVQVARS